VTVERYGTAVGASFSADGRRVVSTGVAGSGEREGEVLLRVSPCDVCGRFADVLKIARSRADRPLTAAEREQLETSPG